MLKNQKGITLIALIITIIVMLILVGVTINVALNGGLFNKAEEATTKTKITQIQEALAMKRGEVLADKRGVAPDDYGITLDSLNLPEELKTQYENKLIISKDGKLYYNASTVTNAEEQNQFETMGIEEYVETNTGELADLYTFTLSDIMTKGYDKSNVTRAIPVEEFWPEGISEDFKNSVFDVEWMNGAYCASNVRCDGFTNAFAVGGDKDYTKDWTVSVIKYGDEIWIAVYTDTSIVPSKYINEGDYIEKGFENLEITIGLPE